MNKRILVVFLVLVTFTGFSWADSDAHARSPEEIIEEIRHELDLAPDEEINPNEVPPELLETLGDTVMAEIHPDEDEHQWMDRMMGGEGSESLASAHRWMGYRYLAGGSRGSYGDGFGMMGPGMMGGGRMGPGMMGRGRMGGRIPYDSPKEILKRRYAEGEITREEYLQMLEDLER